MEDRPRRRFLATTSLGFLGSFSGCIGSVPLLGSSACKTPPNRGGGDYTRLSPANGPTKDLFGASFSISGDNAVIGAPFDSTNGSKAGAAYLFSRDDCGWKQQSKLLPKDGNADARFGKSVVMSDDIILIGAIADTNDVGIWAGSVFVFERTADGWQQSTKLLPAADNSQEHTGDKFGFDIALHGKTAAVSATSENTELGKRTGAVYLFTRSGGKWQRTARLTADDAGRLEKFGSSVAFAGNTLLVSAPRNNNDNGKRAGAVYAFERGSKGWTQRQKIVSDDGAPEDRFGSSLAATDKTVLVGARREDIDNTTNVGAAYAYERSDGTWSQRHKLTAPNVAKHGEFGISTAFDGQHVLVGALYEGVEESTPETGRVYVFDRSGGQYRRVTTLSANDIDADDPFGYSVAASEGSVLVGSVDDDNDDDNDDTTGPASVYLYRL